MNITTRRVCVDVPADEAKELIRKAAGAPEGAKVDIYMQRYGDRLDTEITVSWSEPNV